MNFDEELPESSSNSDAKLSKLKIFGKVTAENISHEAKQKP